MIIVGSLNFGIGNDRFVTSTKTVHDDYFAAIHDRDIALVKTREGQFLPIDDVTIARAVIGNELSAAQEGWECQVSGWGPTLVAEENLRFSAALNHATTLIKSDAVCRTHGYLRNMYDDESKLCTGGTKQS